MEGRGVMEKTKTNAHARCKNQNRSPRGGPQCQSLEVFQKEQHKCVLELHRDCKELGENQGDEIYQCFLMVT